MHSRNGGLHEDVKTKVNIALIKNNCLSQSSAFEIFNHIDVFTNGIELFWDILNRYQTLRGCYWNVELVN